MMNTEWYILNLRAQVRNLQSLLNYLESREGMLAEDFAYSGEKLREVTKSLKELEERASRQGSRYLLSARWLN